MGASPVGEEGLLRSFTNPQIPAMRRIRAAIDPIAYQRIFFLVSGMRLQSSRAMWAKEMLSLRVTGTGVLELMRMPLTYVPFELMSVMVISPREVTLRMACRRLMTSVWSLMTMSQLNSLPIEYVFISC